MSDPLLRRSGALSARPRPGGRGGSHIRARGGSRFGLEGNVTFWPMRRSRYGQGGTSRYDQGVTGSHGMVGGTTRYGQGDVTSWPEGRQIMVMGLSRYGEVW